MGMDYSVEYCDYRLSGQGAHAFVSHVHLGFHLLGKAAKLSGVP